MLIGTNLVHAKQYNLRIVHEVIRLHGPLSRADVARRTELTAQTISNLVKELLAAGLVYEVERRQEGRGAPSTTLALDPEGAYAVGLDLDRDHLTAVLVDLAGEVRQRIAVDLDSPLPDEALTIMVDAVNSMIGRQGLSRGQIRGIGVGVPGPMRRAAEGGEFVVNPKRYRGWHDVPLASWLEERLDLPVFLQNNATAAAIGERWYGAGRRIETFFYMYLGSGLGGGLVIDGRPHPGFSGNAGEVGYLPSTLPVETGADDRPHVGLHFDLPALYRRLRDDGAQARTPEDLDRLLAAGNARLLEWMDTAAEHLAGLWLAIEYLIDPEAIVVGGRLPDLLLKGLLELVAARLPARRVAEKVAAPRQLLATAGVDAAALGVATIPIYELFAPAPKVLQKASRDAEAGRQKLRPHVQAP